MTKSIFTYQNCAIAEISITFQPLQKYYMRWKKMDVNCWIQHPKKHKFHQKYSMQLKNNVILETFIMIDLGFVYPLSGLQYCMKMVKLIFYMFINV